MNVRPIRPCGSVQSSLFIASSPSPSVGVYSAQCRVAAKIGGVPTDVMVTAFTSASEPEPERGGICEWQYRFSYILRGVGLIDPNAHEQA
jgi:hypothetical protein